MLQRVSVGDGKQRFEGADQAAQHNQEGGEHGHGKKQRRRHAALWSVFKRSLATNRGEVHQQRSVFRRHRRSRRHHRPFRVDSFRRDPGKHQLRGEAVGDAGPVHELCQPAPPRRRQLPPLCAPEEVGKREGHVLCAARRNFQALFVSRQRQRRFGVGPAVHQAQHSVRGQRRQVRSERGTQAHIREDCGRGADIEQAAEAGDQREP